MTLAVDFERTVLPLLILGGALLLIGAVVLLLMRERATDQSRWKGVPDSLTPLGFAVSLHPLARLAERSPQERATALDETRTLIRRVSRSAWLGGLRPVSVRWSAQRDTPDGKQEMVELELGRRGGSQRYVESFLLSPAPAHWPQFAIVSKPTALRVFWAYRWPLRSMVYLLAWRYRLVVLPGTRGRAIVTARLYNDLRSAPRDEQWFIRGGTICCHWSRPLDGDRPAAMVRRFDEFVEIMERHMLRLPRGL